MSSVVEALKEKYGAQIRVTYRHLPLLSIHDKALLAAEASEVAGAQGKFWEMHDLLYLQQQSWGAASLDEVVDVFVNYAQEIGLDDLEQFQDDLENRTYQDKVMADYQAATEAGFRSTPSFAINGVEFPTDSFGLSQEGLETFIKLMELRDSDGWFAGPEAVIDPTQEYVATIETDKGDIVIELYPDTAPANVNSFAFLAEQGWYDGTTFHRVLPGFVAQGGDPTGTGVGFPGYRCADEVVESRTFDGRGIVSLANSGPNSNGGQFFITYDATENLNDAFTIIGKVIEGQDVANNLTPRNPQANTASPEGDTIINITVEKKE